MVEERSPRSLAAVFVLLAAVLLLVRLIIDRAPSREWGVALLLAALGIGLLLWDVWSKRPASAGVTVGDHVPAEPVRQASPPAALTPSVLAPETGSPDAPVPLSSETAVSIPTAVEIAAVPPPSDAPPSTAPAPSEAPSATADPAEAKPPTAKPAAKPAEKKPAAPTKSSKRKPNDLTAIEGIGPKISAALISAGITTFAQLADTPESRIRDILIAAKLRILGSVSETIPTWAEQARLAMSDDPEALARWISARKLPPVNQ